LLILDYPFGLPTTIHVTALISGWENPVIAADTIVLGQQAIAQSGIGLGSAIAIVCSWHRNRSILWALLAGLLSWIYVIYFALTRQADEVK